MGLAAYELLDLAMSIYDVYELGNTLLDDCISGKDKLIAAGMTIAGFILPGNAKAWEKLGDAAKDARAIVEPVYKTTKEAKAAAEALGFKKINETVHDGQAVFNRGNDFITRDLDGHNGGAWKMADSVKNLGRKETRSGTYDANLNRIGD